MPGTCTTAQPAPDVLVEELVAVVVILAVLLEVIVVDLMTLPVWLPDPDDVSVLKLEPENVPAAA